MIFSPTPLAGAFVIDLEKRTDSRGSFARAFCVREFDKNGLETRYVQANVSENVLAGTVRGMHFQRAPHAEVKLVRCVKGAVFDVIVDVREDAPTYLQWFGIELSEDNGRGLYVPRGFAHGYQTLADGASLLYLVSDFYEPSAEGGLRSDDPRLAIRWPLPMVSLSEKDRAWPLVDR